MIEWYTFAFASAIFTSIAAVIEKKTLLKEHALEFSTVLAILNVLLSLFLLPLVDFNFPSNLWFLIIIAGIFAAFAFLLIAKAVRHMEISSVSPILVFAPVFVLISSIIFIKENANLNQFIGIGFMVLGLYVLETHKHDFLSPFKIMIKSKYIHYILLALILYSFSAIIERYILRDGLMNIYTLLFIAQIVVSIVFIILIFTLHDGYKGIKHGFKNAGKWIFFIAILTIAYRLLYNQAISMESVFLVSPIKRLSSIFVILLGGELFHEKHILKKVLATLIMLVGVFFVIS